MKRLILIIIILLILGLIFYTAETKEIIKITGEHSVEFYKELRESKSTQKILDDLKERYTKIKN
ncbi:MAG: hypothetical protein AABY07_05230 [Nanoarchaeota archaeon]